MTGLLFYVNTVDIDINSLRAWIVDRIEAGCRADGIRRQMDATFNFEELSSVGFGDIDNVPRRRGSGPKGLLTGYPVAAQAIGGKIALELLGGSGGKVLKPKLSTSFA